MNATHVKREMRATHASHEKHENREMHENHGMHESHAKNENCAMNANHAVQLSCNSVRLAAEKASRGAISENQHWLAL